MGRLLKEEAEELKKQIENGYATCKTCKIERELIYFGRQKAVKKGEVFWSYKIKKCKCCCSPKGELVKPHSIKSKIKTSNKEIITGSISMSNECKGFVKRLILMKGYIDTVEAFKLVHYHLETFGYIERLILDTEEELTLMFIELLKIYKEQRNF